MKFARRLLVTIVLIGLGVAILVPLLRPDSRLSYKGQSLDAWLSKFGSRPIGGGLMHSRLGENWNGRDQSAVVAIRAIGTNALGPLMKAIKRPDDPDWLSKAKTFIDKTKLTKFGVTDPASRREQAAMAIYELGTDAAPALPELASMLTNYPTAAVAAHALAGLGPMAIPAYQTALASSNKWINDCGVWGLAQLGPAANRAAPQVLPLLAAPSSADVHITTWALGEIREPAATIVPELVQLLKYPDKGVRMAAIQALTKYGSSITNHLPALTQALDKEADKNVQDDLTKLIANLAKANQMTSTNSTPPTAASP